MKRYLVLPILICCTAGCDSTPASEVQNPDNSAIEIEKLVARTQIPTRCGKAGLTSNDIVAVSNEFEVRTSPSMNSSRLKNNKASEILGRTHYHVVDNSTKLRVICKEQDWSEIQIVEPDWLNHVKGWIPNKVTRDIKKDGSGRRVYVVEDFLWNKSSTSYKPEIVTAVNKISRENSRCMSIDPSSVAKSGSKSKPGKPVFYVTCNPGGDAFNIWFEPTDIKHGRTFTATQDIGKNAAVAMCEQAAKDAATHPSTVQFSQIMDLSFHPSASGRSRVLSTFEAKNAFNLELSYSISCLFDGEDLIETLIAETA